MEKETKSKKIISGKVREVYDTGKNELIIVTTDRISAFDVILDTEIPLKGVQLNKISNFWFDYTKDLVKNHLISTDTKDMPKEFQDEYYQDRTIMVHKLKMFPYEVIVRGYLFGSMWNAYTAGEEFCGKKFTGSHELAERLVEPIVTPSTKSSEGHDINITREEMAEQIGKDTAKKIFNISLALYNKCYDYAFAKGIIIADTKFEFGLDENGNLVLADEIFTPDSSRFWSAKDYRTGESPKSFDKQFVRDWLIANKLDGVTPAPKLPDEIACKTAELYAECRNRIIEM
ncbi:MAG TPA: phosphoribosylaminoimidazolesuccinocarboxamide synthase [Lachnospiraceae bacterium]|nr:phosphoribosylaminoimidazolesuccinocarboxamide synthase [Lachnospiraceae bacterium]